MHSIFSFFTGAGFLDLGFEHEGFRVDLVNEYSREFLAGYRHSRERLGSPRPRFGHHLGSVEHFVEGPGLDLLSRAVDSVHAAGRKVGFVGGPPCPDFSVAGKNAGGEGDNGRLTATYFEIIERCRPDFFIFENVEGLWRTKIHRQFYEGRKSILRGCGYALHDRLINALDYGVGQDRSRIFLVGLLDGDPEAAFPWDVGMTHDSAAILSGVWPTTDKFREDGELPVPEGVVEELTVEYWFRRNRVYDHPNAHMAFSPLSERFHTVLEGDVKKKSFKRLHRHRYSPTAAYGNNEVHLHPYRPRRISVAEALAIQSLPAEYELPPSMPLSACFKTIGNGVPYKAARGLAKSVAAALAIPVATETRLRRTGAPEPFLVAAE